MYLNALVIIIFAFGCSPSDSDQLELIELPDQVQVESIRFSEFADRINTYVSTLNEKHQVLLQNYISNLENKLKAENGRRTIEATCNCLQGQTNCSASSWASECCICCSNGASAVCGVYWFVAACRCDEVEVPSESRVGSQEVRYTTFYPKRFNDALNFAKDNGIDVKGMETEFKALMNTL
ncbi:MAG: hypothetical protein BroJett042_29860 [Bacteroidota bacterium]|nr:MAG: hypothetical protein BroJett042_29860 [Bacteroidota bacterium]